MRKSCNNAFARSADFLVTDSLSCAQPVPCSEFIDFPGLMLDRCISFNGCGVAFCLTVHIGPRSSSLVISWMRWSEGLFSPVGIVSITKSGIKWPIAIGVDHVFHELSILSEWRKHTSSRFDIGIGWLRQAWCVRKMRRFVSETTIDYKSISLESG